MQLSYAGGETALAGGFDKFNAIEIHQADVRIANSTIELNANGYAGLSNRGGLGTNERAAIFIRGAQPVIVGNKIIDNQGDAITIDANSMNYAAVTDPGRTTGAVDAFTQFGDNRGPLVRLNVLDNSPGGGSQINGMVIRGSTLTTESMGRTDVVRLRNDLIDNLHTFGGLCLQTAATPAWSPLQRHAGFCRWRAGHRGPDRRTLHILHAHLRSCFAVRATRRRQPTAAAGTP